MRETQKLLNAAFKTGDRKRVCTVISAMALGMNNVSAFALKAGVDRTMLYRGLELDPRFNFVLNVLSAADYKLFVVDHPKLRKKPSLVSEHLNGALDTEDITLITKAFSETLRAQENVVMFAKKTNVSRVALYKAFTAPRVPRLGTVLSFLNALRLRLAVKQRDQN
jgi:probable addiction module antidote protein